MIASQLSNIHTILKTSMNDSDTILPYTLNSKSTSQDLELSIRIKHFFLLSRTTEDQQVCQSLVSIVLLEQTFD